MRSPSPSSSSTSPPPCHARRLRRRIIAIATIAISLGGVACRDSVRIPPPDASGEQRKVPEPAPSTVTIPVTLSLASVAAQVEAKVPRGQSHEDEWHPLGSFPVVGTLYVKEMWERDPLALSLSGDRVNVSAHIRYRARVAAHPCVLGACRWVPLAGCGQDGEMPTMDIGLQTVLAWHADWTVDPHTRARPVQTGVRCKLTEAKVDVTERVQQAVQKALDGAAPEVDQKLRDAAALHRRVESVWRTIQQPIAASKGVYVLMQPRALAASKPRGSGTTVTSTVSVVVQPRLVVGERPTVQLRPLPDAGTPGGERGFSIQMVAELPFDLMEQAVRKKLVGHEFRVSGHTARVTGAHVYAAGPRLVLAAAVRGDARGTLYFIGTPVFDPVTQTVLVPDLDFSVESQNVLGQAAKWLLYDDLRQQMRAAARFSVGERLAKVRRDVDAALDRELTPGVQMRGAVDRLTPIGVYVFSKSVAAVVEAEGHAEIRADVGAARKKRPAGR